MRNSVVTSEGNGASVMGSVGQHSVEELVSVTFSMYTCSLHVAHEKIKKIKTTS